MRRKDREIQSRELIDRIIEKAQVCRLGLSRDNLPYVVPVSFGYDGRFIYFHTAREGKKIDYMTTNPQICFELEDGVKTISDESSACDWSQTFYSVIGFGVVEEITDRALQIDALNDIMTHYSGRAWAFDERQVDRIRVWRIVIDQVSGKHSKDPSLSED